MLEQVDTQALKGIAQDYRYTASQRRKDAAHADLMAELAEAEIARRERAT